MSDMQEILHELMIALDEGQINAEVIEGAYKALSAVPEIYHVDAVKALLRTPSSDDEQPEDYLAVKTFTSNEFNIGDEIADDETGCKLVVVAIFKDSIIALDAIGLVGSYFKNPLHAKRTGRNFPAIAAIMEELRK